MEAHVLEWLNLVARWVHVIAAIMWIGDSFLFMWMDRSLEPKSDGDDAVVGGLWMVHSGGFYQVEKRKYLKPGQMPRVLHWFKWEAGMTWISGFCLLVIVYYSAAGVYLTDPKVMVLTQTQAVLASLGLLVAGVVVYEAAWASPLKTHPRALALSLFGVLLGVAYLVTHVFSGRAAFLQLGAMMGTVMAANVWTRIIPAQRVLLAATAAGTTPDVSYGMRAKQRSTHNHYVTLPLLFTMLSNHFPSTFSNPHAWVVFGLIAIFGVSVKQIMIAKERTPVFVWAALVMSFALAAWLTRAPEQGASAVAIPTGPPVTFKEVRAILDARCTNCHSSKPTNPAFPAAPLGIEFDNDARVKAMADRIKIRAVVQQTMPLANLTGMTDDERLVLGRWIEQGAQLQ